jgi:exopolysaccharide biosynthesis polyprenyl glycosylphosphotransferase
MIPLRRKILLKAFKLFDLLVMVLCFVIAAAVVAYNINAISFEPFLEMRIKIQNFAIFFGFLLIWHVLFSLFGLYHSRRFSSRRDEIVDVAKATSVGTLVIVIFVFFFEISMVTPTFLGVFWATSTGITILNRLALRYALGKVRAHGHNLRHLVIVGTNPRGIEFARKIESKPELGYRIIGFVDNEWSGIQEFQKNGYRLVSNLSLFPDFIREHVVDEVAISLPVRSFYSQISQIVARCEEQGIIVRYLSNIFNLKEGRSTSEEFGDHPVVAVYTGAMRGWQILVKHILDFFVSLILVALFSPLLAIVSILIKITSPGPVFFVQERVGVGKRRFRLYKFRTMIKDAEEKILELEHLNELSGPVFKINDDPRITRIGKFLRKTSIDELPQLFNVVKGDMSLVGPRPLPVRDYEGFDEDWHRRRFSVRPGITCLWQVNGRSNTSFDKWMKLDMEYIDNWSLGLDLKILLRTVPAVLKGSGAA